MLLFLLLLQPLIGFCVSEKSFGFRIHQANTVKVKCDSLPFRSLYNDTKCYFAVSPQVQFELGQVLCNSALKGALMDTSQASEQVLSVLLLDPSTYHNEMSKDQNKSVLCRFENPNTCNHDERTEMPGKCVKRVSSKANVTEARQLCISQNYRLITIENDDENKAIARLLYHRSSYAWVDVDKESFKRQTETGETKQIRYLHWWRGDSIGEERFANNKARLLCSSTRAVVIVLPSRITYCQFYGLHELRGASQPVQALCMRPTDGDFAPVEKKEEIMTARTYELKKYYNDLENITGYCISAECYDQLWTDCAKTYTMKACMESLNKWGDVYADLASIGRVLIDLVGPQKTCPRGWTKVRLLWFRRDGAHGYQHNLTAYKPSYDEKNGFKEIEASPFFAGLVSSEEGACGATVAIKKWRSRDRGINYYGPEDGKDHGVMQDGGKAQFYLWKLTR